jgi:hypothetical protein
MTWLLGLLKYLPSARTMTACALAACLVAALSGWAGYRLASDLCEASKVQALQRAIEQSQSIARQDAEILASQAAKTITIYKTREAAHDALSRLPATRDCVLDADGMRAIYSVYPAIAAGAESAPDPVRATASAEGWALDYSLAGAGGRSVSLVGVQPAAWGAE